jgi:hypothetical protein
MAVQTKAPRFQLMYGTSRVGGTCASREGCERSMKRQNQPGAYEDASLFHIVEVPTK